MKKDKTMLLQDPSFLMVLLATLVKRNGGEIEFNEKDMASITKKDVIGLFKVEGREGAYKVRMVDREKYKEYLPEPDKYSDYKTKSKLASKVHGAYDDDEWEN